MELGDLTQAVHVVDGEAAAGSLKQALRLNRDQVLINEDQLSVGPALATNDLGAWRSVRERFTSDMCNDLPNLSFEDYANNGLLRNLDRIGEGDPVIVWAALGLPEQLLLAWVVCLFDRLELDLSKLWVIQFKILGPGTRVLGIGELTPENIHEFCPEPQQLNSEIVEALRRSWRVYTSGNPSDLVKYVAATSSTPVLHEAVRQLVYRYPDLRSGVGFWDERLLRYTAEKGPRATSVIGFTMGVFESPDYVGDIYLFRRLVALASADLAAPLVSITGNVKNMRECQVNLTSFGQRVLAGEANHVEVNGIDDWVGGVHLSSAEGNVTFRDGDRLVLP